MNDKAIVKIKRFDPSTDQEPVYQTYEVPAEGWVKHKVIDTLRYIYENLDPSLAFREPCRQRLCGACLVMVNKKTVLACNAMSEAEMVIEPVTTYPIIKDLVVEIRREKD